MRKIKKDLCQEFIQRELSRLHGEFLDFRELYTEII